MDLKRFFRSFTYSLQGFEHIWKYHQNIRFHIVSAVVVLVFAYIIGISSLEILFILVAIFVVIISEMINTAIEEMTNLITTEHRKEAKIAKDVASAAVLLSSFFAILIGLIIFLPHLF